MPLKALLRLINRPRVPPVPVAQRLLDKPIITREMFTHGGGDNICNPSVIRVPPWLPNRLGNYYLYFSHHRGTSLRLAWADQLTGPWHLQLDGVMHIQDWHPFGDHLASPDVHVDEQNRLIIMFFHSVDKISGKQLTFFARSRDGFSFDCEQSPVADFYLKIVKWRDTWIGMSKGGVMYISAGALPKLERLPKPAFRMKDPMGDAPGDVRHVALDVRENILRIYYSRVGDSPESILRSQIDLNAPMHSWRAKGAELVLKPETEWEGATLPVTRSRRGAARRPENALRDPAIYKEGDLAYLFYCGAAETNIGLAALVG